MVYKRECYIFMYNGLSLRYKPNMNSIKKMIVRIIIINFSLLVYILVGLNVFNSSINVIGTSNNTTIAFTSIIMI
jgi:hypothetical protein